MTDPKTSKDDYDEGGDPDAGTATGEEQAEENEDRDPPA